MIIGNGANMVIAEGSVRALRAYKKLMLHRIKWDEFDDKKKAKEEVEGEEHNPEDDKPNKCSLIWEVCCVIVLGLSSHILQ